MGHKSKHKKHHYVDDGHTKHSKKHRSRTPSPKHRRHKDSVRLTLEDKELLKEKRSREKELMKALETPEEKRARRLAKKEAKMKKQKTNAGWDDEYMGYTNADNPFGDHHLLDTFVWSKKAEKDGIKHFESSTLENLQKQKALENRVELEKVKKRRKERELELEMRDKEREQEQREKEAVFFNAWEKQEDSFHLQQAKLRSKIRIEDGRAKPIDLLAKYINSEDDEFSVEMHEPYKYLNGLTINDLEDLLEDINVYKELEQGGNGAYWRDITIVTEHELSKLKKIDSTSDSYVGERRSGINSSVTDEVLKVFKGKTLSQLQALDKQIRAKIKGGAGVDIAYWESLLDQLKAHTAQTRLRERHQEQLKAKLFKLKQQQGIENNPLQVNKQADLLNPASTSFSNPPPTTRLVDPLQTTSLADLPQTSRLANPPQTTRLADLPGTSKADTSQDESSDSGEEENLIKESDLEEEDPVDTEYAAGNYSPRLLSVSDLGPDTIIYDEDVDNRRLDFARKQLIKTGNAKSDNDLELLKKAKEGMDNDEAQFSVEFPLEKQQLAWSDKYRPRKPRFFNRVHTGFEWNKYNQTHYDLDNPPPKIVQGYKFNIFYPDLINKSNTPQYTMTPCDNSKEFSVLKFKAGPPYEDIAFKIVNREWEYSYKHGFRCQFHNNIFQLWFHFKRYRYRR